MTAPAALPPYVESVNSFDDISNFRGSGSYSQRVKYEIVERETKRSIDSSFVLSLALQKDLASHLRSLSDLKDGWDSYGAERPSRVSIERASAFLGLLSPFEPQPSSVTASAEGGVAILFSNQDGQRVLVEFLNDNEDYGLFYNIRGDSKTITLEATPSARSQFLSNLSTHLRSSKIATNTV